jgi:hypothetical protein
MNTAAPPVVVVTGLLHGWKTSFGMLMRRIRRVRPVLSPRSAFTGFRKMVQKPLAPMESQSYLLGCDARGASGGPSSSASRRRAWLVAPMAV